MVQVQGEIRRVRSLHDAGLVAEPPHEALDRLCRVATTALGVPTSVASFVLDDRQVYAGASGLGEPWFSARECPLPYSLCRLVAEADAPLVIEDAVHDERVRSELAVRDLDVGAYLGVPLRDRAGVTVGAVCAVDARARRWTAEDQAVLEDLSGVAADVLAAHAAPATLDQDSLTGLPSRRRLERAVLDAQERARTEAAAGEPALVVLDLCDFALVNSAHGHAGGDVVLQEVAHRLRRAAGAGDVVARLAADQFAVLVATGPDRSWTAAAQALTTAVQAQPVELSGWSLPLAVRAVGRAVGLAECPEEVVRGLLEELATAKREAVRTRHDVHRSRAGAVLRMRSRLAGAVARDELRLVYQPVVGLGDNRPAKLEALLRWEDPDLGLVPLDDFIPLAERTGLIIPIGEWVIDRACGDLAALRAQLPELDLAVAVNVAPVQVAVPSLADAIGASLRRHGLPPDALDVELTERALLDDRDAHQATLRRIHDLGVPVSLDDFGTGFSALSYLTRFPIDVIKIDRSFIATVGGERRSWALVAGIIDLAHRLGMHTVAEGVETHRQRRILTELGCERAQGFLYSPGVPVAELPDVLRRLVVPLPRATR